MPFILTHLTIVPQAPLLAPPPLAPTAAFASGSVAATTKPVPASKIDDDFTV
jgi:hypothetical protein